MGSSIVKALFKFILPIFIILGLYSYNYKIGLIALVLFLAYILFSGRASFFTLTGSINYSRGKINQALIWYERAYKSGRSNPKAVISYAYLLLKNGNVEASEAVLNKLLQTNPGKDDEMYAKSNLALVIWKKGDLDGATAMLEEVFASFKTSTIYGSLGYLLILKGDLGKALQFNLEAYDYNNTNTVILDNLGQTYLLMGEYEKAQEIYETLIAKSPAFPEAYYNYGLVLANLNQPEKAVDMMEKALCYRFTSLSSVSKEEIEGKLSEIKGGIKAE